MADPSEWSTDRMERLIAEADACHIEEVHLVEALTGGSPRAERKLREVKAVHALLSRVWAWLHKPRDVR